MQLLFSQNPQKGAESRNLGKVSYGASEDANRFGFVIVIDKNRFKLGVEMSPIFWSLDVVFSRQRYHNASQRRLLLTMYLVSMINLDIMRRPSGGRLVEAT